MRLKSAIESILRVSPPLYRLGSHVYHRFNSGFRTLSPGAPGAIRQAFEACCQDPDAKRFAGDYYEFGVFRGGTFLAASRVLEDLGLADTALYGFDSFEGLPQPEGIDSTDTRFFEGQFACSRAEVAKNLSGNGMNMDRAVLIEGFYETSLTDTLRQAHPFRPVAVALLDCDYYASTKTALDWLLPYMRAGSVLLFDDWYSYGKTDELGQPKAYADWLAANPRFRSEDFCEFPHNGRGFILRSA
ncbi:TylF/MycF/NovP-related O-methyltransferase [Leisingera sp. XS_AS12]|uniref:TylF/MycF/NovP-related O-methyltransferase n=1 Tax=Leisingera sp. XS_AS12 TaxID=3241294 RepID=UPI0035173614